ncbi:hypothetical protein BDV3_001656 [Batrachochytrium dendrobatidis]|uniref:Uncharacterized protein n=1 Tax=Batrachochytrium dendrobatidis (strain JEL423) TaxID=403673 RepID=A0A177WTW6_BATDL|nr:hypothetical protein BDEG_26638 [Batrachochytrium dendrobatidis JEL423]
MQSFTLLKVIVFLIIPIQVVFCNTAKLVFLYPPSLSNVLVNSKLFIDPLIVKSLSLRSPLRWPYDYTEPIQLQTFPLEQHQQYATMYILIQDIQSTSEIRVNWPATDPTDFNLELICSSSKCTEIMVKIQARCSGVAVPNHSDGLHAQAHFVRFSVVLERVYLGVIPESTIGSITLIAILISLVIGSFAKALSLLQRSTSPNLKTE